MKRYKKNAHKSSKDTVEIYYWSKYQEHQEMAGGDIRAMYIIPQMMQISENDCLLFTPYSILPRKMIQNHRFLSKLLMNFAFPLFVFKYSYKKQYNIKFIYCSTCYVWDIFSPIIIKFITGSKLICVSHDTPKQLEGYQFYRLNEHYSIVKAILFTLIGRFQVFLLNYIDIPISISLFALGFFNNGVRNRALLSSNGIPSIINENELNKERTYDIVLLGRIIPRKNISKIFRCFSGKKLAKKIKILVITNSNNEAIHKEIMPYLDEQIIDLCLKFNAEEREKFDLLKQSKLYISLSVDENFSIAAMEAASMGTVLILSDYQFFKDIYGEAAIYVDPDDCDTLWNIITEFLTTEERMSVYRRRSMDIAKKYLNSNIARNEYLNIIKRIQDRKKNE